MGILVLSLVASLVLACILWLVIGDKFPLKQEIKFPAHNNIAIYSLLMLIPIYIIVFFSF